MCFETLFRTKLWHFICNFVGMKKTIVFFAVALVALASCSKKDDPAPAPVANFTFTGDNNFAPSKISFTSTSTNAAFFAWDFGDDTKGVGQTTTHVYTIGKTFTVRLTATNSEGMQTTISKTVTVKPVPTKMILSSVLVEQLPLVRADGSAWDSGSGPDPYFKVSDAAGTNYFKSKFFADVVAANFPLTYTGEGVPNTTAFPLSFTALDFDYTLEFWDYNTVTDTKMIATAFKVRSAMPTDGSPYPDKVKFTGSSASFTINISWQ